MAANVDMSLDEIIASERPQYTRPRGGGRGGSSFRGRGGRGGHYESSSRGGRGGAIRVESNARRSSPATAPAVTLQEERSSVRTTPYERERPTRADGEWKHDRFKDATGSVKQRLGARTTNISGFAVRIENLASIVTSDDILELFGEFGHILQGQVENDAAGRSLGIATVIFQVQSSAEAAFRKYNNVELDARPMKITVAETPVTVTIHAPATSSPVISAAPAPAPAAASSSSSAPSRPRRSSPSFTIKLDTDLGYGRDEEEVSSGPSQRVISVRGGGRGGSSSHRGGSSRGGSSRGSSRGGRGGSQRGPKVQMDLGSLDDQLNSYMQG